MSSSHVLSDQVFGSSRRVRFIGMSPMDSLLSAIDKAHSNNQPASQPQQPYSPSSASSSSSSSSSPQSLTLPSLSSYLTERQPQQKSPTMSIQSLLDSPQEAAAAAAAAGLNKTEASVASLLAKHPNNGYLPPSP